MDGWIPDPCDLCDLYDLRDLSGLAHVAGWEPYSAHDLYSSRCFLGLNLVESVVITAPAQFIKTAGGELLDDLNHDSSYLSVDDLSDLSEVWEFTGSTRKSHMCFRLPRLPREQMEPLIDPLMWCSACDVRFVKVFQHVMEAFP